MEEEIKSKLIIAGVKNLIEFGYPNVTAENILTDEVYKLAFKSMLNDNLGYNKLVDKVINDLKSQINK